MLCYQLILFYVKATCDVGFMSVFGQVQQKSAEVKGALEVFHKGVKSSLLTSISKCHTPLLRKLEQHIRNYLVIVSHVNKQVRDSHMNI